MAAAPAVVAARTLGAAVAAARDAGVDRLDAELLLAMVAACSRTRVIAFPETPLPPEQADAFAGLVTRRAAGEPFAYLAGRRAFHDLELAVSPAVLIPRPETELLVERVLAELGPEPLHVLELGTGSGAIAAALAQARPGWRILATDCSGAALAVARENLRQLGLTGRVTLVEADWYAGLGRGCFDAVVSNPPYVAAGDPALAADVARFEPELALYAGDDGLDALRAVIAGAPERLRAGGSIALEHGFDQGPAVRAALAEAGFVAVVTHADVAGHPRATLGRLPAAERRGAVRSREHE